MSYLTLIVLLGTSLLGCVAGVLGSFAVLRKRALVGDLFSHAALPGLCIAFLILGSRDLPAMLLGAFLTGLLGVGLMTAICRWTRTKEDAAIGIVLSTFFGAGIVLSSVIQNQSTGSAKAGLETFIFGQAAGMTRGDVYLIAIVSAISLTVVALLYKEFKLLSFDPAFARVLGEPVGRLDMAMMGLLALITVVGLPAVGAVLMAAMLIIPGATARFWTKRLGRMIALAGVIGGLSGACGVLLSADVPKQILGFDPLAFGDASRSLPTGPLIVLSGTSMFLFSVFFAPQRGIIARVWAQVRLRRKTGSENLLRTLYELNEPKLPQLASFPTKRLLEHRAWSPTSARRLARRAKRRGWVEMTGQSVCLTSAGCDHARRLVRAHRLWELFLIQGAGIAPDHVDRDADTIEHVLTPEIIDQLEATLIELGRLPGHMAPIPDSPHTESESMTQ